MGEIADTAKLARAGIKVADKADDVADVVKVADDVKFPDIKYPGDDPSVSPGIGFEWRGKQPPSTGLGAWYNPGKKVSFHWDLEHSEPIAPHWDYIDEHHNFFRIYKDGRIELTKKRGRKSGKEFK